MAAFNFFKYRILFLGFLLGFLSVTNACKKELCSLSGTWFDQVGWKLDITESPVRGFTQRLDGTLTMERKNFTIPYGATGWLFGSKTRGYNSTFGFVAVFYSGTIFAWIGQCYIVHGHEELATKWVLKRREDKKADEWLAKRTGQDDIMKRHRPRHHPDHGHNHGHTHRPLPLDSPDSNWKYFENQGFFSDADRPTGPDEPNKFFGDHHLKQLFHIPVQLGGPGDFENQADHHQQHHHHHHHSHPPPQDADRAPDASDENPKFFLGHVEDHLLKVPPQLGGPGGFDSQSDHHHHHHHHQPRPQDADRAPEASDDNFFLSHHDDKLFQVPPQLGGPGGYESHSEHHHRHHHHHPLPQVPDEPQNFFGDRVQDQLLQVPPQLGGPGGHPQLGGHGDGKIHRDHHHHHHHRPHPPHPLGSVGENDFYDFGSNPQIEQPLGGAHAFLGITDDHNPQRAGQNIRDIFGKYFNRFQADDFGSDGESALNNIEDEYKLGKINFGDYDGDSILKYMRDNYRNYKDSNVFLTDVDKKFKPNFFGGGSIGKSVASVMGKLGAALGGGGFMEGKDRGGPDYFVGKYGDVGKDDGPKLDHGHFAKFGLGEHLDRDEHDRERWGKSDDHKSGQIFGLDHGHWGKSDDHRGHDHSGGHGFGHDRERWGMSDDHTGHGHSGGHGFGHGHGGGHGFGHDHEQWGISDEHEGHGHSGGHGFGHDREEWGESDDHKHGHIFGLDHGHWGKSDDHKGHGHGGGHGFGHDSEQWGESDDHKGHGHGGGHGFGHDREQWGESDDYKGHGHSGGHRFGHDREQWGESDDHKGHGHSGGHGFGHDREQWGESDDDKGERGHGHEHGHKHGHGHVHFGKHGHDDQSRDWEKSDDHGRDDKHKHQNHHGHGAGHWDRDHDRNSDGGGNFELIHEDMNGVKSDDASGSRGGEKESHHQRHDEDWKSKDRHHDRDDKDWNSRDKHHGNWKAGNSGMGGDPNVGFLLGYANEVDEEGDVDIDIGEHGKHKKEFHDDQDHERHQHDDMRREREHDEAHDREHHHDGGQYKKDRLKVTNKDEDYVLPNGFIDVDSIEIEREGVAHNWSDDLDRKRDREHDRDEKHVDKDFDEHMSRDTSERERKDHDRDLEIHEEKHFGGHHKPGKGQGGHHSPIQGQGGHHSPVQGKGQGGHHVEGKGHGGHHNPVEGKGHGGHRRPQK